MLSKRAPGTAGVTPFSPEIDDGTLCRATSPVPSATGLRAIPGVKVAWKSMGHLQMTGDAVMDVMPTLPAKQKKFYQVLSDLARKNVLQDIDKGNVMSLFGVELQHGQVRHFMRDR